MIVLDASMIVKWFVPEVGDAAAEASLAAAVALIAPELVRVEVASARASARSLASGMPSVHSALGFDC